MWSLFSSSNMPKENNEQVLRDQNQSSQRTVNNEAFCKQNLSLIKVIPHPQCVHLGALFKSLPYGIYIVDFQLMLYASHTLSFQVGVIILYILCQLHHCILGTFAGEGKIICPLNVYDCRLKGVISRPGGT